MKKRTLSNCIMVLVIAALAVGGVLFALSRREADGETLGSRFQAVSVGDALTGAGENICTVRVECVTVLSRLDDLDGSKTPYLPADGVIVPTTAVSFADGETAFSVLQRVCEAAELPLEYSWTPLYDSYYVEGIAHLYEFDCGTESGWMFKVNGVFPNVGASAYALRDGDEVVWCYTCAGLGEDVGGTVGS